MGAYPPQHQYHASGVYPSEQQYHHPYFGQHVDAHAQTPQPTAQQSNSLADLQVRAKAHADSVAQEQLKAHINEFEALSNDQVGEATAEAPPPLPDANPPLPAEPPTPEDDFSKAQANTAPLPPEPPPNPPLPPNAWSQQQEEKTGPTFGAAHPPYGIPHQQFYGHGNSGVPPRPPLPSADQHQHVVGAQSQHPMHHHSRPSYVHGKGKGKGPPFNHQQPQHVPFQWGSSAHLQSPPAYTHARPMRATAPSPAQKVDAKQLFLPPGRKHRKEPLVIVLRGLPGSGKSHIAKLIQSVEKEHSNSTPRILCFDDYFLVEQETFEIDPESGRKKKTVKMKWSYDPESEEAYMKSYMRNFIKTLDKKLHKMVIVDSLNLRMEDVNNFFMESIQRNWHVFVAECVEDLNVCVKRNVHDWKESQLHAMKRNWEPTPNHIPQLDFESFLKWVSEGRPKAQPVGSAVKNSRERSGIATTSSISQANSNGNDDMQQAKGHIDENPKSPSGSAKPESKGRWTSDDEDDDRSPEPTSGGRWNSDGEDDNASGEDEKEPKSTGRWASDDSSGDEDDGKSGTIEKRHREAPPPLPEMNKSKRKRRWDAGDNSGNADNEASTAQEGTVKITRKKKRVRWADLEEENSKKMEADMGYSLGFEELRKRREAELAGRAKAKVGKSILSGFQKRVKEERQMKRWFEGGES